MVNDDTAIEMTMTPRCGADGVMSMTHISQIGAEHPCQKAGTYRHENGAWYQKIGIKLHARRVRSRYRFLALMSGKSVTGISVDV